MENQTDVKNLNKRLDFLERMHYCGIFALIGIVIHDESIKK